MCAQAEGDVASDEPAPRRSRLFGLRRRTGSADDSEAGTVEVDTSSLQSITERNQTSAMESFREADNEDRGGRSMRIGPAQFFGLINQARQTEDPSERRALMQFLTSLIGEGRGGGGDNEGES